MRGLLLREGRKKGRGERRREGGRIRERRGTGRRGDEVEETGEETFLVMWPRTLSALNPPLKSRLTTVYAVGGIYWTLNCVASDKVES